MELSVRTLRPDDPAWTELTRTGIGRSAYHCPTLVTVAAATHDMEVEGWGAYRDNLLIGGIMVTQPLGSAPRPLPIMSYTGPVIRPSLSSHRSVRDRHTARVTTALLERVGARRGGRLRAPAGFGDIRSALAAGWTAGLAFTYELHLDDLEDTWNAMDDDRRRLVRRAEGLGYDVTTHDLPLDQPALHDEMMRLYSEQSAVYGPATPPDRNMWRDLANALLAAGHGRIYVAHTSDGEPVAFQFAVVWGDHAANLLTGSSRRHADAGANTLLRWRAASALHHEGVRRLDLNGAPSGTAGRFKASLGAVLTDRWDLFRADPRPLAPLPGRIMRRLRREISEARRRSSGR